MVAKIGVGICVLAAILLYGAGILFWLAIISALVILIAGFAGAYIAKPEMRKTGDTARQMESEGASGEEIIAFIDRSDDPTSYEFDPIPVWAPAISLIGVIAGVGLLVAGIVVRFG